MVLHVGDEMIHNIKKYDRSYSYWVRTYMTGRLLYSFRKRLKKNEPKQVYTKMFSNVYFIKPS